MFTCHTSSVCWLAQKVLRKYEHPPDLVLKALDATMTLKGDPSTGWEDAKIMLADTYFFSFFIKHAKVFDKDHLDEAIVEKLEDFLMSPESEPDVVGKASIPCGAMIKWVRAVYEWAKTKKVCPLLLLLLLFELVFSRRLLLRLPLLVAPSDVHAVICGCCCCLLLLAASAFCCLSVCRDCLLLLGVVNGSPRFGDSF